MVDYSEWDKIDVSDDEDDTHPNVDKEFLFKLRHENRLMQMAEMQLEKMNISQTKEQLQKRKMNLDLGRSSGKDVTALEKEYNAEAKQLAEKESAYQKKEELTPWNVDTIGQDGFSKTVINTKIQKLEDTLTDEEKAQRFKKFSSENEVLLKEFGMLRKHEDSMAFLQKHDHLVCLDASNYLVIWCIKLAVEGKFDVMDYISCQCVSMNFLMELAKQSDLDPRACVAPFFGKIAHGDETEYKQTFNSELELFRQRIRRRAEEKTKELEKAEEKERLARLGPGGLDPFEVMKSLPKALQTCFKLEDIPLLQKTLLDMPEEEASKYMKQCIDSGLWCPPEEEEKLSDSDKPKSDER